jgi:hypothetical protein
VQIPFHTDPARISHSSLVENEIIDPYDLYAIKDFRTASGRPAHASRGQAEKQ